MSVPINLTIEQGTDFSYTLTVDNDDGSPKDLTTYTAQSKMRRSYKSLTSYDITATITFPLNGEIKLSMLAADSSLIPPGRYVYDLKIFSADMIPVVTRVIEGIVTVTPQVTY